MVIQGNVAVEECKSGSDEEGGGRREGGEEREGEGGGGGRGGVREQGVGGGRQGVLLVLMSTEESSVWLWPAAREPADRMEILQAPRCVSLSPLLLSLSLSFCVSLCLSLCISRSLSVCLSLSLSLCVSLSIGLSFCVCMSVLLARPPSLSGTVFFYDHLFLGGCGPSISRSLLCPLSFCYTPTLLRASHLQYKDRI